MVVQSKLPRQKRPTAMAIVEHTNFSRSDKTEQNCNYGTTTKVNRNCYDKYKYLFSNQAGWIHTNRNTHTEQLFITNIFCRLCFLTVEAILMNHMHGVLLNNRVLYTNKPYRTVKGQVMNANKTQRLCKKVKGKN